tara:strand:- start:2687 stop:3484 length:798 start_codon:yes stop_codon:yes gene_type:complete
MPDLNLREGYEREGFAVLADPVLPSSVVTAALDGMNSIRRGEYDRREPPESSLWNPGEDPDTLCKIEQPQKASQGVFDLIRHPTVGKLAAEVTGADWVQVWWVQLLYKPSIEASDSARVNIGWHQDRHYWQSWEEGSELLTAWIALSDVGVDSGPMRFVAGSHDWGFLDGASDFKGQDVEAVRSGIQIPDDRTWEEKPALMRAGGLSLHHCLTFHGSTANRSGRPRMSFAVHLRTQNSRPVNNERKSLTRFIDDETVCPVIYSSR